MLTCKLFYSEPNELPDQMTNRKVGFFVAHRGFYGARNLEGLSLQECNAVRLAKDFGCF